MRKVTMGVEDAAAALREASDLLTKGEWDKVRALAERHVVVRGVLERITTRDPNRDYEAELRKVIFHATKDSENPKFEMYEGELFAQFDGKFGPIFKVAIVARTRKRASEPDVPDRPKRAYKKRGLPAKQQHQ